MRSYAKTRHSTETLWAPVPLVDAGECDHVDSICGTECLESWRRQGFEVVLPGEISIFDEIAAMLSDAPLSPKVAQERLRVSRGEVPLARISRTLTELCGAGRAQIALGHGFAFCAK